MRPSELLRIVAAHMREEEGIPLGVFPAALPIFFLRLSMICVERKELGIFREFVLRAIATGLDKKDDVAGFLGVRSDQVGAELDQLEEEYYISRSKSTNALAVMEKGIKAISVQGLTGVVIREGICYFNSISRRVDIGARDLIARKHLLSGTVMLPSIPARPPPGA